jgi:colanic acid/amylovoran biosynthesis glycosyltransferase
VKICYIVNQYPKVSHSFIRREILALERLGASVLRIAHRGWDERAVDAQDAAEQRITRYVLQSGVLGLLRGVLPCLFGRPRRFFRTLLLALRMSLRSEKSWLMYLIYLAEASVAARWVIDYGADHIHAHFGTNSTDVAMLTSLLADVPFSFTVHGPEEFDKPEALGLGEKIRRSSFVVAVSSYGRSQLMRWVEVEYWPRIAIVHCGLDAQFTAMPALVRPARVDFVCVGRLAEQKGQVVLLEALRILADQQLDCNVVFAGDGPLRNVLEGRAAELGLTRRIRITGWIDGAQVRNEILNARAMVLPSFAEGLPVVIMEAMALCRPVITTYVAGIPELVINGSNGWLIPAGDPVNLAEAMRQCLQAEDAVLEQMGQKGRAVVLQRHNIDTEAAHLLKLFAA